MKGTLHKTESGWQVRYPKYDLTNTSVQGTKFDEDYFETLPLIDNGHIDGLKLYDSNEGLEVDFEIVDFPVPPTNGPVSNSFSKYAKLVDKATRPLTEDDAWITMKEGAITVNFIPMPEFYDPKYPDYPTRAQQIHIQIAEECFRKYPNNKELYTTDELKDAYKAGVIDGLKEWTLDSYDRPKYPEVKIICPRCKAIMPCPCNLTWYDIMAESNSHDDSEILAYITKNYNPPTKKQDRDK